MMKQVKLRIPLRILTLICGLFISLGAFAQITVQGHVKDDTGEPLPGASVKIVGTQTGTATNFDGNFELQAPRGAQLVISFMGFASQTVTAAPRLIITLTEDAKVMEDVVVIGYGTAKKTDLTGSVVALKPETKNKGVIVNAQDMLQGKVAGVSITSDGGAPGGYANVRIRGAASLEASSNPLYVIDGVIMDDRGMTGVSNPLALVNPNDIESFNVLKDASATAIYGSRGSNGVIIITTKKGRKGQKLAVSYNGSVTMSVRQKSLEVMDGNEYRDFITKQFGAGSAEAGMLGTANTDWQKEIYRTAISHDHNISVQGAAGFLPYRVSVGYTNQQGILRNSDFQRVTGAINLNPSFLDDHLTLNLSAKGMYAKSKDPNRSAIGDAIIQDPTKPVHDNSVPNFGGYYEWSEAKNYDDPNWTTGILSNATNNPVAELMLRDNYNTARSFIGNAEVIYKVHGLEALSGHVNVSGDFSWGKYHNDISPNNPTNFYYGWYGDNEMKRRNTSLNAYLQYAETFNDIHSLDIMAGYEWQHYWYRTDQHEYGKYRSTNNTNADKIFNPLDVTHKSEHYLVSFFGRVNYTLMNKFLFTATLRDDGSSRFKDHWALFPSAAFAWKISEEPIIKNLEHVSEAKLRLGWGITGQQEVNSDYGYIPTYTANEGASSFYPISGSTSTIFRPEAYNPDLKWEQTTTYNIGLDLGYFKNRLNFSFDLYLRETKDLLSRVPVAAGSNFKNYLLKNIGKMRNYGAELMIDWKAIQTRDWFWALGFNATYNHNEITDINVNADGTPITYGNIGGGVNAQAHAIGKPLGSFFVYQQVYDQQGLPIEGVVVDRTPSGTIDPYDRYYYKSAYAPWTFGFSSRLEWKNWDFGFNLRANVGNYVFNAVESGYSNLSQVNYGGLHNRPTMVLEKNWQTYSEKAKASDYFVQNGSFLKCDNITLGYSFDNLFRGQKYHGIGGRVYVAANNVFTVTKYKGLDPEVFGGIDSNIYPRPFSMLLGLNLNF